MGFSCTEKLSIWQGQTRTACGVTIKLISVTADGMHTGNIQSRFTITYPDGVVEEWIFQDPSARFHLFKGYAFEVISSNQYERIVDLTISNSNPVPGGCHKEGEPSTNTSGSDCCPGLVNWFGICKPVPAPTTTLSTPSTPVSGQKEYVFEFSGNLSGLSNTAIGAINKIVQLLGGKTAYIEGNKIVVVM